MEEPEGIEPPQWTNEYFNLKYDEVRRDNPDLPYTQAYERVEIEHVARFGKIRYSSYDSFRNCRKALIFK